MTSILDGRTFRDGILRLTESGEINVWISRHVDPSVTIDAGRLGPTVYAALSQIAHDNGCVLMPIENVLLIGPEEWVDQVAADAWGSVDDKNRNRNDANRTDTIQLNWEALTTPKEAIEQVIGEAANLPHDLWPAVKLSAIRRPLAELLIRSQFREPVKPVVKQYEHRYIDTGGVLTLEQVRQNDRHTKLRRSKNAMVVTATPAAHRLLLKNWLMGNSPKHSNEEATFSLKTKVKAGAIITQLAKTAGWVCQIDEPAMEACQQQVEVSAKNQTLQQLIELVCEQAGVQVRFDGDVVRVFADSKNRK